MSRLFYTLKCKANFTYNFIKEIDMNKLNMGTAIALGVGIGTALGVAFNNISMGVALGAGLGVAFGAALASKKDDKPKNK
jgi:transketolase N-terminal domain/subunit